MGENETLRLVKGDAVKVEALRTASEALLKETEETADKAEKAVEQDITETEE